MARLQISFLISGLTSGGTRVKSGGTRVAGLTRSFSGLTSGGTRVKSGGSLVFGFDSLVYGFDPSSLGLTPEIPSTWHKFRQDLCIRGTKLDFARV